MSTAEPETCGCGNTITPPDSENSIVAAGGWCGPSEALYEFKLPPMCSDCKTRMLMIAELGIDPGRNGENLRFTRGGIRYQ